MREPPNISEDHLRACLQDQYGLSVIALEFLPIGLDTRAGVFRVVSDQGTNYLIKAKAGAFYEPCCLVPRYLRDQGIASVVAPLPTKRNTLWAQIGEWTLILYPFIEGESNWVPGLTDGQWKSVGAAFSQIHQTRLPPGGFASLRTETFDPSEYSRWIAAFESQQLSSEGGDRIEQALRASWLAYQDTIRTAVNSLEPLADVLRRGSGPQVICHADLHPGNLIRDQADHVFVIDWDDVMLAPKERDFLFVGKAPEDGSTLQDASPFFQGYGQVEIDWVALTYYCWERFVQDVIECARTVFFRDDLGELAKDEAAQLFRDNVEDGGEVEAAKAAAAHLPSDLSLLLNDVF